MIAKCVALLAVVAQINCYVVNSNCGTPVVGSAYGASGIVGSGLGGSSGLVGTSGVVGSSGVFRSGAVSGSVSTTRNIVTRGKYPVALENTGPVPDSSVQVTSSHVQAPVQEKPTVRLPAAIPVPTTVAHSCTCYKQILRPRVHNQYITVPTVQRYIETTHTPVVENIQYEAVPVNDESTISSGALLDGEYAASGLQVASAPAFAQVVPVSAAIESIPVSAGIQSLPVSSCGVAPVASSLQVASVVPVRAFSTGCSTGCGSQGLY